MGPSRIRRGSRCPLSCCSTWAYPCHGAPYFRLTAAGCCITRAFASCANPSHLEIVLDILAAYLEYTEEELAEKIPGYPRPVEAVGFLSALADGCLTSLLSLEPQLLERVEDALTYV